MMDDLRELQNGIRTFTMSYLAMLLTEPNAVDLSIDVAQTVVKIVMKFTNEIDCGRMVGSEGRTVNGYRRMIYGVATKYGIPKILVMLVDPSGNPTGDLPDNYRRGGDRTSKKSSRQKIGEDVELGKTESNS
jgi:predicted RNA-binding protein YlqC (UPF0109 family)